MRKMYLIILSLIIGLATTGFAAEKGFKAMLAGSDGVKTMAKGEATFELSKDGKKLSSKVDLR